MAAKGRRPGAARPRQAKSLPKSRPPYSQKPQSNPQPEYISHALKLLTFTLKSCKIYLLYYTQFTRKTVRRHKICVLLRCFDSMYARYISRSSALYLAQILCFLTLESSRKKNFFIFKADEEGVLGSTLIENNAENEEIIPF